MELKKSNKIYGDYYIGLDIGTNSVGIAATDLNYNLIKYKGEPVWCSHLFEEGHQCADRRGFRTARRRLDRRQQRVQLIDELFASEVGKVDKNFYIRKKESALWREDKTDSSTGNMYFNDEDYKDVDYHKEYPTIHHLIVALMEQDKAFDIRLVNIAIDWLVAHRGHFLSEISVKNVDKITDFETVYNKFIDFFNMEGLQDSYNAWIEADCKELEKIIKSKSGITTKKRELKQVIYGGKVPKEESVPYKYESMINFLAGGKIKAKDLFQQSEYESDFSFSISDDMEEILPQLGDDAEFVSKMTAIYEWSVLTDVLNGEKYISKAKVEVYDQHKKDLEQLKKFVRKYAPKEYYKIFKESGKELKNYTAYSYNLKSVDTTKDKVELPKQKANQKEFNDFLKKTLKLDKIEEQIEEEDLDFYEDMVSRIENAGFMPKQVNSDNRVIPHQLYQIELERILDKAENYLPFLKEKDADGLTITEKIKSVFTFRVPYYVGPLHRDNSENAWIKRKAEGKILPWNFDQMVDKDASEKEFIRRMTNTCTYLPSESVLPKWSLLYSSFMVLNEINNIKVNGQSISVEAKQRIYHELFEKKAKVTVKMIRGFLESNNYMQKEDVLEGIDVTIKSSLKAHYEFRNLLAAGTLDKKDVESIIEHNTYVEDRGRYRNWINREFPNLSAEDKKYIGKLKYNDFGRISKKMLNDLQGDDKTTGEMGSIMHFLWTTNDNFMQLLSNDRYTFAEKIEEERKKYYESKEFSVEDQLDEMYVSNAVKRPILRTLDVVDDVVSTLGHAPKKFFVEMARGADPDQKGRTTTRKQQLLDLYKNVEEDTRILEKELENMGDMANNRLQSEAIFLYYLQLGRCAYSGQAIDLSQIKSGKYNIDHIYPQCYVKDDSIVNNKVLVLSGINGDKKDIYPISEEIRTSQKAFWSKLRKANLMSDEKYKRLTRNTPFSDEEKQGFINRQLVETRQSMKAVTQILKQKYKDAEIVYVKARLASQFRQEFLTPKSRLINDLHHAKDAYLNVVVGNVYHERFTRKWFSISDKYTVNPKSLFKRTVQHGEEMIWNPDVYMDKVKSIYKKNNIKMTRYSFCQKGGLFDQMPLKKKADLVPLKKGMDPVKYGGYNKSGATFFIVAAYDKGTKKEVSFVPIELMFSEQFLKDEDFAKQYVQEQLQKLSAKTVSNVWFPLGMRKIKIASVLSLDNYEVWVSGKANKGTRVLLSSAENLIFSKDMEVYIKRVENYVNKKNSKQNIVLDEKYDGITSEQNINVYDCLLSKMETSLFSKMPCCQAKIVRIGREKFLNLSLEDQTVTLIRIIECIKAGRKSNVDLRSIGGSANAASVYMSANLSSSSYKDIRIVDYSPAGLHRKESVNLKDFLK